MVKFFKKTFYVVAVVANFSFLPLSLGSDVLHPYEATDKANFDSTKLKLINKTDVFLRRAKKIDSFTLSGKYSDIKGMIITS
jgi:hypothetical protein